MPYWTDLDPQWTDLDQGQRQFHCPRRADPGNIESGHICVCSQRLIPCQARPRPGTRSEKPGTNKEQAASQPVFQPATH